MKMILAVINHSDSSNVISHLMKEGFVVTKLSSSGGFLRMGNVTVLIGVEPEKVQSVIDIITEDSHSRKEMIPASAMVTDFYASAPIEVIVGGATIFVFDVERFEKV